MLCGVAGAARAEGELTSPPTPANPTPEQIEQALPDLGNPLNKPITGASENPLVVGTAPPPSLEALQATRPGDEKGDGIEPGRAEMIRTAALTYGAQGGLAARSFALNEMLRRYEAQLDVRLRFQLARAAGRPRPDPDASAGRLGRADGLRVGRGRPGRARNLLHLSASPAPHSSPPRRRTGAPISCGPGQPAAPERRRAAAHAAGSRLLEQVGRRGLGAGREAGGRDLPVGSRPPRARHRRHGALPRAGARAPRRAAASVVPDTAGAAATATACRSATARSASPTSPACRPSARRWTPARGCPQ